MCFCEWMYLCMCFWNCVYRYADGCVRTVVGMCILHSNMHADVHLDVPRVLCMWMCVWNYPISGFDVMFDANLKPWFLEANAGPCFDADSPVDAQVKQQLVTDTLALASYGLRPDDCPVAREQYLDAHRGLYTKVCGSSEAEGQNLGLADPGHISSIVRREI